MDTLFDCFENHYEIIKMLPTGFCGFHALSFCFTGTQSSYADIIDDCLSVFTNVPEMFELRTNFANSQNSLRTVNDYAAFMRNAIQRVQSGLSVDNQAWCGPAAMSLLYDVCVYTILKIHSGTFSMNSQLGAMSVCLILLAILTYLMVSVVHL